MLQHIPSVAILTIYYIVICESYN